MSQRGRAEQGSLSIEYAIVIPMVFLVLALIFAYGRVADVNANLDSVTRDAARAASQASTVDQARAAVAEISREMSADLRCTPDLQGDFVPGSMLTVTVTCDWNITGLPGPRIEIHSHSEFTSVIDPNREVH